MSSSKIFGSVVNVEFATSRTKLDRWRRTNAIRKNKSRGTSDYFWGDMQNRRGYYWNRLVDGGSDHSTMGDRANRAFMTRKPGIVIMDMDSLGEATEGNEKHADQA